MVARMILEHEYALLGGLNRARIGQVLGAAAAAVSSILVWVLLALVGLAQWLGYGEAVPALILWPIGAGAIYVGLYWAFDRWIWRWKNLRGVLRVPDLAGTWHCAGQTINADKTPGYVWEGEVTIVQTWDRIRVRLKTKQSGSNSITASLVHDEADGFRLHYTYKNDPNIDEPELEAHRGSAELVFDRDLRTARGEYFNGHGRYTFGTMRLTRKN
ncbi:MAG: hypothetical protein NVV74_08890 [Magnetospirillum sp.]|nr:hypothetical protein [Magnetospirillum sp.]